MGAVSSCQHRSQNFRCSARVWDPSEISLLLTCCCWASRGVKKQKVAYLSASGGQAQTPHNRERRIAAKGGLGTVISKSFDGRHWKYPPDHKRSVDLGNLIFKTFTRMDCAAQEQISLSSRAISSQIVCCLSRTRVSARCSWRCGKREKCMLDDFMWVLMIQR